MKSQALAFMANSPLLLLPLAALFLFLGVFTLMLARLWWRGKSAYDGLAQMPLDQGDT